MELLREILSKNLHDLRRSRKVTQVEVCLKIGIHQATYNRWENGSTWPDTASLEKLAEFYGVRSTRFFYDPDLDLSTSPAPKVVSFDEKLRLLDPLTREHLESLVEGLIKKG